MLTRSGIFGLLKVQLIGACKLDHSFTILDKIETPLIITLLYYYQYRILSSKLYNRGTHQDDCACVSRKKERTRTMITDTGGTRRCCFLAVFLTCILSVYGEIVIKHVEREVRGRFGYQELIIACCYEICTFEDIIISLL